MRVVVAKSCGTCRESKPIAEFHRNRARGDGHASECKSCRRRPPRVVTPVVKTMPTERLCPRCHVLKASSEYYTNRDNKRTGLSCYCKPCVREYIRLSSAKRKATGYLERTEKQCLDCKVTLPIDQYWLNGESRDGRKAACKACMRVRQGRTGPPLDNRPLDHPPGLKTCRGCREAKEYAEYRPYKKGVFGLQPRCKSCYDPTLRLRYRDYGHERKRRTDLARYGMTPELFDALLAFQGGVCGSCGDELLGKRHVDHDHASGLVRGITCGRCNPGFGNFKDDARRLRRAIEYLSDPPAWRFFRDEIPLCKKKARTWSPRAAEVA